MSETKKEVKSRWLNIDKIVWILWVVLAWGFWASLTLTTSPKGQPGLHELLTLIYFLGFSFVHIFIFYYLSKVGV